MLNNVEPSVSGDESPTLGGRFVGVDGAAFSHDVVDTAVQTEQSAMMAPPRSTRKTAGVHDIGTAITPRSSSGTPALMPSEEPQMRWGARSSVLDSGVPSEDDDVKILPSRSDQLKHSPAAALLRSLEAEASIKQSPAELVPFLRQLRPDMDWSSSEPIPEVAAAAAAVEEAVPEIMALMSHDPAAEIAPRIMMTPGMGAAGRRPRPHPCLVGGGSRLHFDATAEVRGDGGKEREFSSISSVSIIQSDLEDVMVFEEPVRTVGAPNKRQTRNTPRKIGRPFFGFFAALSSCSRAPKAL
ncbi:hypothetical protein GPECTOR_50g638 [Gonium pectorale]|uniref:Uncharacterized protein n=1 Tax=Gonium pectorale TaxID=33097 RepID=A0A150G7M8_GONPE|nr:hypothetical protein GPECTOR_50g638 [Gonium pectorale]|eukprot:KXZ45844.1 hypothetical protein GPECTOR_50g638 [Gonium pectorale]